jgi:hypothetical protein
MVVIEETLMPPTSSIEELLCIVASWDRATLVDQFTRQPSRFPIDFTPEFYQTQPVDRLRHIYVAMCLQNQRSMSAA